MNTTRFYELLLQLTGRMERLDRDGGRPTVRQEVLLETYLGLLKHESKRDVGPGRHNRCWQLLNGALRALGIKSVGDAFYNAFLSQVDFTDDAELTVRVDRFCILAMLEFGSFRYAYKKMRNADASTISAIVARHFLTKAEQEKRARDLSVRLPLVGLSPIDAEHRFMLGYLALAQVKELMDAVSAMQQLLQIVEEELEAGASNVHEIISRRKLSGKWRAACARLGRPLSEDASTLASGELFHPGMQPLDVLRKFKQRLAVASVDTEDVESIQSLGRKNTDVYLTAKTIDVYIATSMRDRHDFTSMASFVAALTSDNRIQKLNLRYFDPTQSYIDDRIQKGLLECLMIKRARLTIYNAQESDTFGKDSEAAISLALGKPVVVYVPRFFRNEFRDAYMTIDQVRGADVQRMLNVLEERGEFAPADAQALLRPGVTSIAILKEWCQKRIAPLLNELTPDLIVEECINHGYVPSQPDKDWDTDEKIRKHALERIIRHEARAAQFSEAHPLGMQTAVDSGVAQGVMVTRTVEDTADLTCRILLGNMKYSLDWSDKQNNTLLREEISGSPVRVVTSDDMLATAFWDSYLEH